MSVTTYDAVSVGEERTQEFPALTRTLPRVLADGGLLVVETDVRTEPALPLELRTSRRYGRARLTLFEQPSRSSGAADAAAPEGTV